LGVEPEPETLALRDRIRNADPITVESQSGSDNLPGFLTPLIGRKVELQELQNLILDPGCRLLTILGPGGSGKTRLALDVARSNLGEFSHGVYFVPLNPVQSPESILPAIADTFDLPRAEGDNIQDQLRNYLRGKYILLLVDGFEHLLAGSHLLIEILRDAPEIKILITSRSRLNIKGEHLYLLAGMRYPTEGASETEILDSDAVQMLVEGLKRTRTMYYPNSEEIHHLHQICQKVQGMPLGLLLASCWPLLGARLSE
jgi:predicted ATPase